MEQIAHSQMDHTLDHIEELKLICTVCKCKYKSTLKKEKIHSFIKIKLLQFKQSLCQYGPQFGPYRIIENGFCMMRISQYSIKVKKGYIEWTKPTYFNCAHNICLK